VTEIPSTKYQIPNKYQHAAQAPALRVTQIQNFKTSPAFVSIGKSQADKFLCSDASPLKRMFWSLGIEI